MLDMVGRRRRTSSIVGGVFLAASEPEKGATLAETLIQARDIQRARAGAPSSRAGLRAAAPNSSCSSPAIINRTTQSGASGILIALSMALAHGLIPGSAQSPGDRGRDRGISLVIKIWAVSCKLRSLRHRKTVSSKELHDVYVVWAKGDWRARLDPDGFGRAMHDRGYRSTNSGNNVWLDIELVATIADFRESPSPDDYIETAPRRLTKVVTRERTLPMRECFSFRFCRRFNRLDDVGSEGSVFLRWRKDATTVSHDKYHREKTLPMLPWLP